MTDSIGTLHSEYVTYGHAAAVGVSRLDTVARDQLAGALDQTLGGTFGDDETVYVLREVHAELALRLDAPDAARIWAQALATAIASTVAEDPGDGANLVKFADEAEYLACYLVERVQGEAAAHWYFSALDRFHALSVAEALPVILEDLSADRLFTALHRQGRLRDVLAAVPVSVLSGIVVSPGDDDLAGLWPLLVAVVRIADVWALWTSTPLDVVDVAEGYRARPVPDWRDPAALTAIVSDVLRALPGIGRPTGPPPSSIQVEFSWLDLPLLVDRLTRGVATDRWVTPRETAVREAIRAVLNRLGPIGTGTAAEILLRAAVLAEYPEWTDDPLAAVLVTQAASESVVADDGETSEFAGVLLLLRAVSDLNLPGFLARLGISGAIESILLDVACHLTGAEPDDPAVLAFAGRPAPTELWQDLETTHGSAIRRELEVTLRGLRLDAPDTDDLTETLALAMVAAWSRWLTSVPGMTPADLITHFVRRPGRLWWRPRELRVELEARLLDVALRGAGYDQPIESVAWLGGRRVTFRMVDA